MYRLKMLAVFAAGFVLAAVLFTAQPTVAQNDYPVMPDASIEYIDRAVNRIKSFEIFADAVDNFLSDTGTANDLTAAHKKIIAIMDSLDAQANPPIELVALHGQMRFSAFRCKNLAVVVRDIKKQDDTVSVVVGMFITERASCLAEVQDTRLRLIDYAATYGVNPFTD